MADPAGRRRDVRVADAKGAPPTIPFWLGEAPARSDELSRAVSDLRAEIDRRLDDSGERRDDRRVADGRDRSGERRRRAGSVAISPKDAARSA